MLIKNRYEMGEHIGTGSQGYVYQGLDTHTGDIVAIKRSCFHDTLREEYYVLDAMVDNPYVVDVIDFAEEGEYSYIIMEYLPFGLRDIEENIEDSDMAVLGYSFAMGLGELNENGYTHGDFHRYNFMVDADGIPKIVDFGYSSFPAFPDYTGLFTTLSYMSRVHYDNMGLSNIKFESWEQLQELFKGKLQESYGERWNEVCLSVPVS